MRLLPFRPQHVGLLLLQPQQAKTISFNVSGYLESIAAAGFCYSAEIDGQLVACAGVADIGFNTGQLWAFVGAGAGRHMVVLDRAVRRLLSLRSFRRIQASTEADFKQGCRWLEMLDFQSEGLMRKYGPDGADHIRYARI